MSPYFEEVDTGDVIPVLTVTVDETQMFFFSAATYNGHRIHYDKQWARDVEGYDDVLVQGPLQAALLACDGADAPLTLRTYCSAAACTSVLVAGGSKLCRVRMLRHMRPR